MIYRLTVITARRMSGFQQVLGIDDNGDQFVLGVRDWKDVSSPSAPLPPDLMGQQAQDLMGQKSQQVVQGSTKPRSKAPLISGIIPIGHNAMWDMR